MPSRYHETKSMPISSDLGLERIGFFSDAVMAIAITLLVIDLKVPQITNELAPVELPKALAALAPRIMSFVVSFTVVGVYWMSHHRYFGFIKRYDSRLMVLNLLFLLSIACMPFVASLLGQNGFLPLGVITYAAAVAFAGFSISALWWNASHNHHLVDETLDMQFIRTRNRIAMVVPLISLAILRISERGQKHAEISEGALRMKR